MLKRFMSLRSFTTESSGALKELLDTTNETLNGLQNIGINTENWDILIIYIVSHKLDAESRKLWEDKISDLTRELPTLSQFREFLEHRYRALEFLDNKSITKPVYRNTQHISNKAFHVNVTPCIYCSDNHKVANCKKFAMEDCQARRSFVQARNLCFNCLGSNHSVVQCRHPMRCRICHKRHHSLLHLKYSPQSTDNLQAPEDNVVLATTSTQVHSSTPVTSCLANIQTQVLLATALVKVRSKSGLDITLRSLLDQGSQASFVTESTVQLLRLKKYASKSVISGLGSEKAMSSKYVVYLKIQSLHDPSFVLSVKAHVLTKLTAFLPEEKMQIQLLPQLPDLKLADPKYNIPNKIDILLGAEVYGQIILEGLIKGPVGSPVAQNTRLGWILSGKVQAKNSNDNQIISMHLQVSEDELLRRFWEIEAEPNYGQRPPLTDEEKRCEEIFANTTERDRTGRYVVKLPLREDSTCKEGNTQIIAAKRFKMLEKRLLKTPVMKGRYAQVINEYLQLDHMEYVPIEELNKKGVIYLPHHAVLREDKSTSRVRVVFDASCPGTNGVSLNDDLMIGPTLQDDLRHIILRWRRHPVCLVADIVKMYRQIKVASEDVDLLRLLWREDPESEIKHLRLLRVTFGTACAPYLAVRTLQQLAHDEGADYPEASEIILNDFYMDDLMTGCETVEEGIKLSKEMIEILGKGGFELQKWSSNKEEALKEINKEKAQEEGNLQLKLDTVMKILGLTWNRCTDVFEYSITLTPLSSPVTKRKVISEVSRLFDPLGWLAPVIVKAKILIQALWISGIGWDDELPLQLLKDWYEYRNELPHLGKYNIPRWIETKKSDNIVEIHGFCDSSNEAYAAVVYIRVIDSEGTVKVNLVTSKTKVSPIKQLSIPKLELCGALLLAKLLQEVGDVLNIAKENIHAWTDSAIVLAWLSDHPSKWKTFIANRVSEILSIVERKQWSHVSTKSNPADCASRGLKPSELIDFELWKRGPFWLQDKVINYERKHFETKEERKNLKKACHLVTQGQDNDVLWTKYSTLSSQVRVIAWIQRFFKRAKGINVPLYLTSKELEEALITCIKHWQEQEFKQDIMKIKNGEKLNHKSKLTCLNPYLDELGVLRVGGRLNSAAISEDRKHPIIIPAKTHFTNLLIKEAHAKTLHGGPQLMITHLRSRYWILDVKNQVKLFCRKCVTCVRHSSRTTEQLMGQLPPARVTPSRPFSQSGVDYAGPINIRTSKGRGHHAYKGYVCLFVCMATRAIHIELVSDLTSQGFIAAFKRFVARRGHCSDLFSDNGTNFVGAARELRQLLAEEKSQVAVEIADWLANNGTTWHFIPPHAPNFGGLWEAGIKSMKHHLKRVIGTSTLTFEELYTVLSQIEACLNSRPLSQLSNESDDPVPFTPGHFLIGEPPVLVPEVNYEGSSVSSLKRWQFTQRMVQDFWRKWSQEYLSQFLNRYRWSHCVPEPIVGDIVLVKEDDLPPSRWLYGVITEKHPGLDKITRVVSLRCKGVIIKRPVTKLCVLPVTD